jgi:hypothetical protein
MELQLTIDNALTFVCERATPRVSSWDRRSTARG